MTGVQTCALPICWRLKVDSVAYVDIFCREDKVRPKPHGVSDIEKIWASYDAAVCRSLDEWKLPEQKVNITVHALLDCPSDMHDRYLIGNRGGLTVGRGFVPTGESNQTAVALLSGQHLAQKCREFLDGAHGFEVVHEYKWPGAAAASRARL